MTRACGEDERSRLRSGGEVRIVSVSHQLQCLTLSQEIQNNGVRSEQIAEGSERLPRQSER